jgi:hypothetical protein
MVRKGPLKLAKGSNEVSRGRGMVSKGPLKLAKGSNEVPRGRGKVGKGRRVDLNLKEEEEVMESEDGGNEEEEGSDYTPEDDGEDEDDIVVEVDSEESEEESEETSASDAQEHEPEGATRGPKKGRPSHKEVWVYAVNSLLNWQTPCLIYIILASCEEATTIQRLI